MSWVNKYLKEEDFKKIEEAIFKAEELTSGEIVPVIVRKSSSTGHVPLVLTLLTISCILVGHWSFLDWLWVSPFIWFWPFLLFGIYIISCFVGKSFWVQKLLIPEKDELDQVHRRACLEFYLNRIHGNQKRTGVLIFVSVMEKKAVILADEAISSKLPPETWEALLDKFRLKLKKGLWEAGFTEAIEECGKLLKTHFPIPESDENHLKNHLVVKD